MIVFPVRRNAIKALGSLALCAALGGCALSPFDEDSFFRRTTTKVGVTGQLVEPAPFVKEARTGDTEYPPVGITPQRPTPPQSAQGVSQLASQLDQLRQRNETIAATARPASPYDGKIEPGYKPPPLPPVPAYTGPAVASPAEKAEKNLQSVAPQAAKATSQKPKDKKQPAQSSEPKSQ